LAVAGSPPGPQFDPQGSFDEPGHLDRLDVIGREDMRLGKEVEHLFSDFDDRGHRGRGGEVGRGVGISVGDGVAVAVELGGGMVAVGVGSGSLPPQSARRAVKVAVMARVWRRVPPEFGRVNLLFRHCQVLRSGLMREPR
jgi:hypothetical protein